MVATAAVIFLLLPLWRETTVGPFLLEPGQRAVIRSMTPGMVTGIYVDEGSTVTAGQPVARLRNLKLESQLAQSQADYQVAEARADSAMMHYADAGAADPGAGPAWPSKPRNSTQLARSLGTDKPDFWCWS